MQFSYLLQFFPELFAKQSHSPFLAMLQHQAASLPPVSCKKHVKNSKSDSSIPLSLHASFFTAPFSFERKRFLLCSIVCRTNQLQ